MTSSGRHIPTRANLAPLPEVANLPSLWQTVGMTNQATSQQPRPQHREDHKVQKLVQRIEAKLAAQAKIVREKSAPSKN
jgi:cytochrome c-type biogenesis protein CcmH/NrfG